MAYGKIKCDQIVYDDSGDQTVTVQSLAEKAPSASPTFTGTVTVPTASANDNTTKAASTAYVQTELGDYATLAAPAFTGTATGVNLTLSGNLTVNGTTTTIDTATLDVEDKNITLGKVSSPSDTTADGGGITLKGATDKTIVWNNAQDSWIYNQNITVETGVLNVKGPEGASAALYLISDEGDDAADTWRVVASADNNLYFQNYTTGAYTTTLKLNPNGALEDSKGDVRNIPQNSQSGAYTLVAADAGKHIYITTGGVTVPTGLYANGDAVTIINHSGSDQTITQASGVTIYNSADGTTGNRTLAGRGMATLIRTGNNEYYISGAGLS